MGATMPVWGAVVLALGVALITQLGALVLQWRRNVHDFRLHYREEWHRTMRWATDHLVDGGDRGLIIGVNVLDTLGGTEGEQDLVDAILEVVFPEPGDFEGREDYDEGNEQGGVKR